MSGYTEADVDQEMVDDLVEFWHARPDKLLDDFARDVLRKWASAGRLPPVVRNLAAELPERQEDTR